jgi:hypothetical protein
MYKEFYLRILKERNHLEDLGIDGMIIKWLLKKQVHRVWIRFVWLRIRSSS